MAENTPTNDIINDVLRNPNATDALVLSEQGGNSLTTDPGLGHDLVNMDYGQLVAKYGVDVANNRHRIQDSRSRVHDIQSADRTALQTLGDSALSAGAGFVGLSGNTVGVVAGAGLGHVVLDDARLGAVATSELTGDVVQGIKSFQSEELQDRQRLQQIEGALDSADSKTQFETEIKNGEDPFMAGLSRVGRDALNAGDRILSDSAVAGDLIAESLGSLGPSATYAKIGGRILGGAAARAGASETTKRVATTVGTSLGIGASEASGAYSDAVATVMGMTAEQLQGSEIYQGLIADGMDPARAQIELAGMTGETAFARQLPVAAALGLLTSKFESAPIGSFRGVGVANGLRQITLQGVEEAAQSGSSAFTGNTALQDSGFDVALSEGVGEAAAAGAIGGIGQAGISAAPATAGGTISSVLDAAQSDTAQALTAAAVDAGGQVVQAASDLASRPDKAGSNRLAQAAQEVAAETQDPEVQTALGTVEAVATNQNQESDVVAASKIATLRNKLSTLPEGARKAATKILSSQKVQAVVKKAASYDQNVQEVPSEITETVVEETVAAARVAPANVNPETVAKVLQQSGTNLTDNDVRLMTAASNIAQAVNDHTGRQVQISTDENVGLTRLGQATVEQVTEQSASRSIRAQGYTDRSGKQLRSVNDFASDIFAGAQSADGTVISNGRATPVQEVVDSFNKFITHMNNKVDALNTSLAGNNEQGRGPRTAFTSLVGGDTFIEPGQKGAAQPVAYHGSNPRSVAFAQRVAADRDVAVSVYNEIAQAFPELRMTPVSGNALSEVTLPVSENTETKTEETPRIVEEEVAPATSDEQSPETKETSDGSNDTGSPDSISDADNGTTTDTDSTPADSSTDDQTQSVDQEVSEPVNEVVEEKSSDTNLEHSQSDDILKSDDGEAVKFYHGTRADFDNFRDGGIFLTTRKGLAREHALRDGEGSPRLIEANVKLSNPLSQEIPANEDTDTYWLKNSFKLEQAKQEGGYDSILLFNDNEAMVIADTDDQVIQTNPDFDGNRENEQLVQSDEVITDSDRKVHESFDRAYLPANREQSVDSLESYYERAEEYNLNPAVLNLTQKLLPPVMRKMNKRLDRVFDKKTGKTLKEALKDGNVQNFRKYRNTAIVDAETGKYDADLLGLAGLAVVDWLASVTPTPAGRLDDVFSDQGIDIHSISDDDYNNIANGVAPTVAIEGIAANVLKLWNVRSNPDATLGEARGIVEGVVKEYIEVLAQGTDLIQIAKIPVAVEGKDTPVLTDTIRVDGLKDLQKQIREAKTTESAQSALETITGEKPAGYSIGQKHTVVANTQNRSSVTLSSTEQAALKKMQDTPHYADHARASLVEAIGYDNLTDILGWKDPAEIKNDVLRRSVEGKNLSITKNIDDAFEVLNQVEADTPVYYSVGITKVGRHQYQGINPQSNKVLRALVSPTWADLDMSNQADKDAFWLAVAQAADLMKIEKVDHSVVLKEVKGKFDKRFRAATDMVKAQMKGEAFNAAEFTNSVGVIEMQQLAAIQSVAAYEIAQENGDETFRTSLSVELDGLTNGAANMMVNYGQGHFTPEDFSNLQRIGLFLGRAGGSINEFFTPDANGKKRRDLYETTSQQSMKNLLQNLGKMKPQDRAIMEAAGRFSAHFGNFEVTENGGWDMTRNTAKNPMTKVNYGSGVQGVGIGIADDMIIKLYEKLQGLPANTNYDSFFGYKGMQEDISVLFGSKLPADLRDGEFKFQGDQIETFRKNVSRSIGKVLADSTKQVIGDKINRSNEEMVFATNVQTTYLQMKFEARLIEIAEQRAKEGKIDRNKKTGKPNMAQMTQRDYNLVVKEMQALAPLFVSDTQQLAISGFDKETSDLVLSESMDGTLNQKAKLPAPESAGVKAIPFSVIGTGDAMMMNLVYSKVAEMTDTLPIFDGIDVPVNKIKDYAQRVNEQVLASWDRDVMAMGVNNFTGFMNQVQNDPVFQEAFDQVKDENKTPLVTSKSPDELKARLESTLKANQARKAVLKEIAVTVDQMGGSGKGFTRDGREVTLTELNLLVDQKLKGKKKEETSTKEVMVSNVSAIVRNLKASEIQRKVLDRLSSFLPDDLTVVVGSIDKLNEHRIENFADDGQILTGVGNYDSGNGVLYTTTTKAETIVHELVHAATYERVLAHYEGDTHDAVTRLEALMDSFMQMETTDNLAVNEAQGAILMQQAQNNAASKAAALNEFMAYALQGGGVSQALQKEKPILQKLGEQVVKLMRRLLGGVPENMFDEVVFNTAALNHAPVDEGFGNGGGNDNTSGGGESTPPADNYTNFWIDLVKDFIDNNRRSKTQLQTVGKLTTRANSLVEGLRQANMLRNPNDRKTFKAIYTIMGANVAMNTQALIPLNNIFEHIEQTMTPDMFAEASDYGAVIAAFGQFKEGGISDSVSVLLALSQTSQAFRNVLDQLPTPQGDAANDGTLAEFLTRATAGIMQRFTGEIDINDRNVQDVMDDLANSLIQQDQEAEYAALRKLNEGFDKADAYVSGKFSQLAEIVSDANENVQESTAAEWQKTLSTIVTGLTNQLDGDRAGLAAEATQKVTNSSAILDKIVPVRELVDEFIQDNSEVFSMFDKVSSTISATRQAFRDNLPKTLSNMFAEAPNAEQWKAAQRTLAMTDFTVLVGDNVQHDIRLLSEQGQRTKRIKEVEKAIEANFLPYVAQDIKDKAQQLANYMNGQGAGRLLLRNAHAIVSLSDEGEKVHMVSEVDQLVSLYAVDGMDAADRNEVATMYENDPTAVTGLIQYIKALNEAEEGKNPSNSARLNSYKGYIPNHGAANTRIIIGETEAEHQMLKQGYTLIGAYEGDVDSIFDQSYYVSTIRQTGSYAQGVMQNVNRTYKGVDMENNLSVTGDSHGFISGEGAVERITDYMMDSSNRVDDAEGLIPVFDTEGTIVGYERSMDPEIVEQYAGRDENLSEMLGAWHGRQVEETNAKRFNLALVDSLADEWNNREVGSEGEFVNLSDTKDPIFAESFKLIPQDMKDYIDEQFENGLMVRKSLVNQSFGYREASVTDMFSGKTRMPKEVQKVSKAVANVLLGSKAMTYLSKAEEVIEGVVSPAKDLIIIKSLVVPMANSMSNVIQLTTRGVPAKAVLNGYKTKLAEIEQYQKGVAKKIDLEAKLLIARTATQRKTIQHQIDNIDGLNQRLSIAPLLDAGIFSNLSEGLTHTDVDLSKGKLGDIIEGLADRLPDRVSDIAHVGLVSKSTRMYQVANKATQYGDFLAKAIYHDHLTSQGLNNEEALNTIRQEFVNFSILPGRTRSALERMGLTWFMAFKIRSAKIAMKMMRENPVRALAVNTALDGWGTPIQDNIFTVAGEGRLDYALGWEMLFSAPELNPWVQLSNWK